MDPVENDVNRQPEDPVFGPIISMYSRKRAIEDGVLIDVTETAREAGLKWPTCVTTAVWSEVVRPPAVAKADGESESGRLWDVLWMLVTAIRALKQRAAANGRNWADDTIQFSVIATDERRQKPIHKLWASVTGVGAGGAPVITIMMIGED